MNTEAEITKPFKEFAGQNGDYYAETFLKIQKATLEKFHLNKAALIGSFVWAALRGNWLLFWIGFIIDLVAAVNLALVYKYSKAAVDNVDKAYLVERYEGWSSSHMLGAIIVFVAGRLLFAWLADGFYYNQYSKWRVDRSVASGFNMGRLVSLALISHTPLSQDCQHCFKKIWKLCEVLNVRVTTGHRPAQAQEEPAGWEGFSRFCLGSQKFFAK